MGNDCISRKEFFAGMVAHSGKHGARPEEASFDDIAEKAKALFRQPFGRVEVLTPHPRGRAWSSNVVFEFQQRLHKAGIGGWSVNHVAIPTSGSSAERVSTLFALFLGQMAFYREKFDEPRIFVICPYPTFVPKGSVYDLVTLRNRPNVLILAQRAPGSYVLSYLHRLIEHILEWDGAVEESKLFGALPEMFSAICGTATSECGISTPARSGVKAFSSIRRVSWPMVILHEQTQVRRIASSREARIETWEEIRVALTASHFIEGSGDLLLNATDDAWKAIGLPLDDLSKSKSPSLRLCFSPGGNRNAQPSNSDARMALLVEKMRDAGAALRRWQEEQTYAKLQAHESEQFAVKSVIEPGMSCSVWSIGRGDTDYYIAPGSQLRMLKLRAPGKTKAQKRLEGKVPGRIYVTLARMLKSEPASADTPASALMEA